MNVNVLVISHALLFVLTGGLAAVIFTDALQTVIMTVGAVVLAVISKLVLLECEIGQRQAQSGSDGGF